MIIMPSIDWENDALCDVCTRGFTHAEWENRHTEEKTGGDVHDYCCELCAPNEINAYLKLVGYESLEEWGADSDYTCKGDQWYDEHGNEVDLFAQLAGAVESASVSDETSWEDHEDDDVIVNDYYRNAVVGIIRKVADHSWGDDSRAVTLDVVDKYDPTIRVRVFVKNYEDALVLVGRQVAVVGDHLYRIG